jgi:hypothetical protein
MIEFKSQGVQVASRRELEDPSLSTEGIIVEVFLRW